MRSYNPISLVWDWHRQRLIRRRLEQFIPLAKLCKMTVLDVGCGRNKLYPFAFGVDHKNYEGVDVVCDFWDVSELPENFDVTLLLQVIEHLDDPEKALEMLASKTDGFIVVEAPNCDSWLWRVVWWCWRGIGMAKESVHRNLAKAEVLELVSERFDVLDVGFCWFGMIMCVVAKKHG